MSSAFSPADCFEKRRSSKSLSLFVVSTSDYPGWLDSAPDEIRDWLRVRRFSPKAGAACLLPGDGGSAGAVVTVEDPSCPWDFANLPRALPNGIYDAEPELSEEVASALCLGWALGSYRFENYKKKPTQRARLVWPADANRAVVLGLAEGICLARDLVNTPASDMGPEELARAAKSLAKSHGGACKVTVGDALLTKNYPMIHAVGRASSRAPRLVDLRWGKPKHPKLTLVGKGVCFDTGGLDIKPGQYMKLMKKDMGGAALVLGLAHAIMSRKLPINLRVLIPAVENSVSGNAMRPLDVLRSRKGISVEVGDTDAEGRLVLADALVEADSEAPDLIIDAATLTGAARVALGTAMPAIFTARDSTWREVEKASAISDDPVWRMPLHKPYREKLNSKVADISNIGTDAYGGAITAALFLREFVSSDRDWVHMDTMGYNLDARPGRPVGGEALGLLTLDRMILSRFGAAPNAGKRDNVVKAKASKNVPKPPTTTKPGKKTLSSPTARPVKSATSTRGTSRKKRNRR